MAEVAEGRIDGLIYRVSVRRMSPPSLRVPGRLWELRIQNLSAAEDSVLSFQLSGVINPFPRRRIREFLRQHGFPLRICDGTINFILSLYSTDDDYWTENLAHVQIETNFEEEDYSLRPKPAANKDVMDALERVPFCPGKMPASCVICLNKISIGSKVTKMPCSHIFHGDCVLRWLQNRSTCPLCRCELRSWTEDMVLANS